jgi:hypothetical protein
MAQLARHGPFAPVFVILGNEADDYLPVDSLLREGRPR